MTKCACTTGLVALWSALIATTSAAGELKLEIVNVRKIWDRAPHSAFTDLIRFGGKWVCTFREGSGHVPGTDGVVRILVSEDGESWTDAAELSEEGMDLRDPKLSITPDGKLMLLIGASKHRPGPTTKNRERISNRGRVAFSKDGRTWTSPEPISVEDQWLWRVTWHDGVGYGIGYGTDRPMNLRSISLWKTGDGVRYERIVTPKIPSNVLPNESTIHFAPGGEMLALIRNEQPNYSAQLARAKPPFIDWEWHDLGNPAMGPNFLLLPDGLMVYAGRTFEGLPEKRGASRTVVGELTTTAARPLAILPSGGDTSYPGLVWHNDNLWVSYYSSHEGKTAIYLARMRRIN